MSLRTEGSGKAVPNSARWAESSSDEDIVARVLDGDLPRFESIIRRYNQRLFRVTRSILDDDAEAEDVLQETYLRAFENLGQFQGRSLFSTWLTRIAVHEATARRRKQQRQQHVDPRKLESAPMALLSMGRSPEEETSNRELRTVLTKAIDELPPDLKIVFVLRLVEGLDTGQTAQCLDLTESNVKVRLHRARAVLQKRIDEQIGQEVRRVYQFDGERCARTARNVLTQLSSWDRFGRQGQPQAPR